jgi:hypothetical protein
LISDTATPFGGVKENGLGREGSALGIKEYDVVKTVDAGWDESGTSRLIKRFRTSQIQCPGIRRTMLDVS